LYKKLHGKLNQNLNQKPDRQSCAQYFIVALMVVSLLSGCASTQLAYNHADWFLENRADHYFDLNGHQEQQIEEQIAVLHQWHRSNQLPLYTELFAEIERRSYRSLNYEDMVWLEQQIGDLYQQLMAKVIVVLSQVMENLSEQQVTYFAKEIEKELQEDIKEAAEPAARLARQREKKATGRFKDFYGKLNEQQQRLITANLIDLPNITPYSLKHRAEINAQLITQLSSGANTQQLQAYLALIWLDPEQNYSEAYRLSLEQGREVIYRMIPAVHNSASPRQLDYFRDRLKDYGRDFSVLTAVEPQVKAYTCKRGARYGRSGKRNRSLDC